MATNAFYAGNVTIGNDLSVGQQVGVGGDMYVGGSVNISGGIYATNVNFQIPTAGVTSISAGGITDLSGVVQFVAGTNLSIGGSLPGTVTVDLSGIGNPMPTDLDMSGWSLYSSTTGNVTISGTLVTSSISATTPNMNICTEFLYLSADYIYQNNSQNSQTQTSLYGGQQLKFVNPSNQVNGAGILMTPSGQLNIYQGGQGGSAGEIIFSNANGTAITINEDRTVDIASNLRVGGNTVVTGNVVTSISAAGANLSGAQPIQFASSTGTVTFSTSTNNTVYFDVSTTTSLSGWAYSPASTDVDMAGYSLYTTVPDNTGNNVLTLSGDTQIVGSSVTQLVGNIAAYLVSGSISSINISDNVYNGYDTAFFQVWGAAGGRSRDSNAALTGTGGAGGYIEFTVPLQNISQSVFNLSIGGRGGDAQLQGVGPGYSPGGFNGGGNGGYISGGASLAGGGGGGATSVYFDSSLIAIAGGGGGAAAQGVIASPPQVVTRYGGAAGGFSSVTGTVGASGTTTNGIAGHGAIGATGGMSGATSPGLYTSFTLPTGGCNSPGYPGLPTAVAFGGSGGQLDTFVTGGGGGGGWAGGGGGGCAILGTLVVGGAGGGGTSWVTTSYQIQYVNTLTPAAAGVPSGAYQYPYVTIPAAQQAGWGNTTLCGAPSTWGNGGVIITFYSAGAANLNYAALTVSGGVNATEFSTNTSSIPLLNTGTYNIVFTGTSADVGFYTITSYAADQCASFAATTFGVGFDSTIYLTTPTVGSAPTTLSYGVIASSNLVLNNSTGNNLGPFITRYTKLG